MMALQRLILTTALLCTVLRAGGYHWEKQERSLCLKHAINDIVMTTPPNRPSAYIHDENVGFTQKQLNDICSESRPKVAYSSLLGDYGSDLIFLALKKRNIEVSQFDNRNA